MRVIVTATETIQGATIEKYIDTICVNTVIGTNAFSDIGASFTDFFGGYSGSYQNKLGEIYERAKGALVNKAIGIGANAIVGFKVDFDEISGQGKSMFMVAASGTAVKIKYADQELSDINCDTLRGKVNSLEVLERMKKRMRRGGYSVTSDDKTWLSSAPPCKELVPTMIEIYCKGNDETEKYASSYISFLGYDELCDFVYEAYEKNNRARYLIGEHRLFNPSKVLEIARRDVHKAIPLLKAYSQSYSKEDLKNMQEILSVIDNLPDNGSVEMVKGGFMSKDKEKYICSCGTKNDVDFDYCSNCRKNRKGLKSEEMDFVDTFRFRVETLEKLFMEQ